MLNLVLSCGGVGSKPASEGTVGPSFCVVCVVVCTGRPKFEANLTSFSVVRTLGTSAQVAATDVDWCLHLVEFMDGSLELLLHIADAKHAHISQAVFALMGPISGCWEPDESHSR